MEKEKKLSILPIFLTVVIDMIGTTIIIPIIAPLFLTPGALFGPEVNFATRTFYIGVVGALFPLAQFFGAPILGSLSDKYGRKPILMLSLTGTLIARLLFAFGIVTHSLPLIIISPIIDGFTGGNISIAMSAIADISDPRQKAKNFGLIGMAFGIGFVAGPILGGKLSDPHLFGGLGFATPYLLTAILTLFNIILMYFNFKETLSSKVAAKVNVLTGIKNFKKAFSSPNLRTMFFVIFLVNFGFMSFIQSFQVYLIEKFQFNPSSIGNLYTIVGVAMMITQAFILRKLLNKFTSYKILRVSILGLGTMIGSLLLVPISSLFYVTNPFLAMFQGLTQPNLSAVVSDLADKDDQGEILGINQSVMSIAWAIPPLLAGFILAFSLVLPLIMASLSVLLGWLIFISFVHPKKHFEEAK